MTKYSYKFSFKTKHGWTITHQSGLFDTLYGAKFSSLRHAVKSGYTRPRCWQWWRWY